MRAPSPPLPTLVDGAAPVVLWPQARVWTSDEHVPDPDALLERLDRFAAPDTPQSNLGRPGQPVWIHVAWQVDAGSDGRWLLHLRNALVDDARIYIYQDGRRIDQHRLGAAQAFAERPLPTRGHAAPFAVQPGSRVDILARVATQGSYLVPFALEKPSSLLRTEGRAQLHDGIFFGVALTLLAWSTMLVIASRDRLFFWHAALLVSVIGFFLVQTGVGQQVLWTDRNDGLNGKLDTAFAMLMIAAATGFLRHALSMRKAGPIFDGALRALSIVAVTGLLVTPMAAVAREDLQRLVGILAPLAVVIGMPAALLGWRRAEPAAAATLTGWTVLLIGTLSAAGMARGWMAANAATAPIFEISVALTLVCWMPVLIHRAERLRRVGRLRHAADAARADQAALGSARRRDALTGLLDRRGVAAALLQALSRRATDKTPTLVAVYLLDLDGFEAINDTHGHRAGDELLTQVASRLMSEVRGDDVVARLSGDEFVVVASNVQSDATAHALGRKLTALLHEPFDIAGKPHIVSVTIGYALAPEHGEDAARLMRRADLAMSEGKQAGGGQLVRFDPNALLSQRDTVPMFDLQVQRVDTRGDLRRTLETTASSV